MTRACNLLDAELALDRVEGELARELPAHLRAFARAHAARATEPGAPAVLGQARTVEVALQALVHPALADRALALLRLAAPAAIEGDPRVRMARLAERRSAAAYAQLAAAREAVARARFGRSHRALIHALAGIAATASPTAAAREVEVVEDEAVGEGHATAGYDAAEGGAAVPGWTAPDREAPDVADLWRALVAHVGLDARFAPIDGARAGLAVLRAADVRPRTFVVVPGREVVAVVPARIASPAARFAVAHELGHALGALVSPVALPRAVDEALASAVARLVLETDFAPAWHAPLARAARVRRLAIARQLDAIEAGAPPPDTLRGKLPWALWDDPQAQAAYVAAEAIADELALARPLAPQLAAAIARADRAFA